MFQISKFYKRLRELRTSKDLSQQKLADKLGTSKSSINMYERGEREPGLELLEAIADFFNVDLDYLLGKSDIHNKAMYDNQLSPKEQTLLKAYNSKPEMQPAVDKLLGIDSNTEEKKYNPTIDFTAPPLEIAAWGADGTEAEYRLPIEETT